MNILAIAVIATTFYGFSPDEGTAAMRPLGDGELSAVTGRAGVSFNMDLAVQVTMDSYKISDSSSSPNWIVLKGFTIDNGSGGAFNLTTSDAACNITPITMDIATEASGRTTLVIVDSSRMSPRFYSVDDLIFAGQELGSLRVGPVVEGASTLRISSAAPGSASGVEFEYKTRIDIGSFRYAYTPSSALSLSGVHLFGSASGAPELDPAGWGMSGSFQIGDLTSATPNPATFNVGTDQSGISSTTMNLPMQGSLRVEELSFGSTSFGPMAIDGIDVHRLQMRFTP